MTMHRPPSERNRQVALMPVATSQIWWGHSALQGDGGSGGPVFAGALSYVATDVMLMFGSCCADCCFVLSGTLSQQKSKVEALIKAHGGKVAASLTKAVTHVLAAAMGTGKADEGKAKGCCALACIHVEKAFIVQVSLC